MDWMIPSCRSRPMRSRSRSRSSRRRASARARSVSCSKSSRLMITATAIASPVAETKTSMGMPRASRTARSFSADASGKGASIGTSPPTTANTTNATDAAESAMATPRPAIDARSPVVRRSAMATSSDAGERATDLRRRKPRPDAGHEARRHGSRECDGGDRPQDQRRPGDQAQPRLTPDRRQRAVSLARREPELHAELEQEGEAQGFHQQLEDEERLDRRLRQPAGLDRDEQVAPDHEAVQESEGGQPAQRASQRQLRSLPALKRDGEPGDKEDLPVHR